MPPPHFVNSDFINAYDSNTSLVRALEAAASARAGVRSRTNKDDVLKDLTGDLRRIMQSRSVGPNLLAMVYWSWTPSSRHELSTSHSSAISTSATPAALRKARHLKKARVTRTLRLLIFRAT